jgi:hypothetical protein
VRAHAPAWERAGITWQFTLGPVRDKSAAWVECELADAFGQLTLWTSGEAELDVGDIASGVTSTHYDLSGPADVGKCLTDLTVAPCHVTRCRRSHARPRRLSHRIVWTVLGL